VATVYVLMLYQPGESDVVGATVVDVLFLVFRDRGRAVAATRAIALWFTARFYSPSLDTSAPRPWVGLVGAIGPLRFSLVTGARDRHRASRHRDVTRRGGHRRRRRVFLIEPTTARPRFVSRGRSGFEQESRRSKAAFSSFETEEYALLIFCEVMA